MDRRSDTGHLITIRNKSTGRSKFLFLYITGRESLNVQKTVIGSIHNLVLPDDLKENVEIKIEIVTEYCHIEQHFSETAGQDVMALPLTCFFDSTRNVFKESLFLLGLKNVIDRNGDFFPLNRLTAVATGSDFFDREEILHDLWERIRGGKNILLCAPRRFGKTSVMRHMEINAGLNGYRPVLIDLESIKAPAEFISRIYGEINWGADSESEKDGKIKAMEEVIQDDWQEKGERMFRELTDSGARLLFLLDECPYMLDTFLGKDCERQAPESGEEARKKTVAFTSWFGRVRDISKASCAYLLAGSINLSTYAADNRLSMDDFVDCQEVRLNFFDPVQSRTYVEALLLGEGVFLDDEIIGEIVKLCSPGIPYFIQILLSHVTRLYRRSQSFTVKDLMDDYQERVVGLDGRRHFDTFERHFERYGNRKPGARVVLRNLSLAGEDGIEKAELRQAYFKECAYSSGSAEFEIVLGYLEYDFYISRIDETDRYGFASPMLRDYWRKNQR